jgi:serine/threonine protein phosphatase PrpC
MYRINRADSWKDYLCGMFAICGGLSVQQLTATQANAGDSRTVLGVKGRAKPLSFDHKPQNEGQ